MRLRDPERRAALAAQYVLGTLRGPARRRFEALLRREPMLRAEVEIWESHLYPLLDEVPEETPPRRVWQAIEERLDGPIRTRRPGVLESLGFWRAGAALAAAAAVVLAVLVVQQPPPPAAPPPAPVAVVADAQARAAWLMRVAPGAGQLRVRALRPQPDPPGKSYELWVIPDASSAPRSLGLIPPDGTATLPVPADLWPVLPRATALAVSLEPAGGSTTGAPTGPVLYQGALVPGQ